MDENKQSRGPWKGVQFTLGLSGKVSLNPEGVREHPKDSWEESSRQREGSTKTLRKRMPDLGDDPQGHVARAE